jgi:uncharacterized Zn finger protein (UPF0148 family)
MPDKQHPQQLPLFNEDLKTGTHGKIYCSTCHNVHQWDPNLLAIGPGKNEEGDDSTSFLRISNDEGYLLCIDCHPNKEMVAGTEHDLSVSAPQAKNVLGQSIDQAGLCGTCHLPHNSNLAQQLWARKLGPGDDMISRLCNGCHVKDGCAQSKVVGSNSHPINVSILAADGQTDLPLFTPEGRRDDKNGRVFCSTCHDPHQWNPTLQARGNGAAEEGGLQNSFLRLANAPEPVLCGACHRKHLRIQNSPHDLSISAPQAKNIIGQTAGQGGVCGACHLPHNSPARIQMWAQETGPGSLPGWEQGYAVEGHYGVILCTGCHAPGRIAEQKVPRQALHPKNLFILLKEAALIPAAQTLPYFDYPLGRRKLRISTSAIRAGIRPRFPVFTPDGKTGQKGDITCPTCHDPHQLTPGNTEAGSSVSQGKLQRSFLRKDTGRNFCTDCHGYEAIYRFTYYHRRSVSAPAAENSPHWKKGSCSACHTGGNPGKNDLKAGGDINRLCNECHREKHLSEVHPSAIAVVKAGIQQSKNLPLYAGRISCLTCHLLKGHSKPDKSVLSQNPYFLRRPRAELLAFFNKQEKSDQLAFLSARRRPRFSSPQLTVSKNKKSKQQSYTYALCYECHPREHYLQFNVHRNQLTGEDNRINQEMCYMCHKEMPDASTSNPRGFQLKTKLDDYCTGCHAEQVKAHPAEVDHFGKMPSEGVLSVIKGFTKTGNYFLPFSNQRIVCTTCHNPHQRGVSRNKATMKGEDERWRLRFVGYEICAICHRGSFGVTTREAPF